MGRMSVQNQEDRMFVEGYELIEPVRRSLFLHSSWQMIKKLLPRVASSSSYGFALDLRKMNGGSLNTSVALMQISTGSRTPRSAEDIHAACLFPRNDKHFDLFFWHCHYTRPVDEYFWTAGLLKPMALASDVFSRVRFII